MAQTQDPLDFLFGVLDTSSKNNKPVSMPPYRGDSTYMQALTTALSNPSLINLPIDTLNSTLGNSAVVDVWVSGDKDHKNRLKITLGAIPDYLRDPEKFVDNAFKKYEDGLKAARAAQFRNTVIGWLAGTAILMKNGLALDDAISGAVAGSGFIPRSNEYNVVNKIRDFSAMKAVAESALDQNITIGDLDIQKIAKKISRLSADMDTNFAGQVVQRAGYEQRLRHKLSSDIRKLARDYNITTTQAADLVDDMVNRYINNANRFALSSISKGDISTVDVLKMHNNAFLESLKKRRDVAIRKNDFETVEKLQKVESLVRNWNQIGEANPSAKNVVKQGSSLLETLRQQEQLMIANGRINSLPGRRLRKAIRDLENAVNRENKRFISTRYGSNLPPDYNPIAKRGSTKAVVNAARVAEDFTIIEQNRQEYIELNNQLQDLQNRYQNGQISHDEYLERYNKLIYRRDQLHQSSVRRSRALGHRLDINMKNITMLTAWQAKYWMAQYAKYKQLMQEYNALITQGGLADAFITGNLWVGYSFSPGFIDAHEITYMNGEHAFAVIATPKTSGRLTPVNSALVNLYYLTPQSLLKTVFWDGQLFHYLTWKKQQRIKTKILGDSDLYSYFNNWVTSNHNITGLLQAIHRQRGGTPNPAGLTELSEVFLDFMKNRTGKSNFIDMVTHGDFAKQFISNPNCLGLVMDRADFLAHCQIDFSRILNNDPLLFGQMILKAGRRNSNLLNNPEFAALYDRFNRRYGRYFRLNMRFSPVRLLSKLYAKYSLSTLYNKSMNKLLAKLGFKLDGQTQFSKILDKMLKTMFKRNADYQRAVSLFTSGKISLNVLTKAMADALIKAILGTVTGPFAVLLSGWVQQQIEKYLMKVAKPFVKMGADIFALLVVLFLLFILWISESPFLIPNATYQTVLPQHSEVYVYPQNTEIAGTKEGFGGTSNLPPAIPPVVNKVGSCPITYENSIYCSQGYTNTSCSHEGIASYMPVDLATSGGKVYSPDYCNEPNANCKVQMIYYYATNPYCSPQAVIDCNDKGVFVGNGIVITDDINNVKLFIDHVVLAEPFYSKLTKRGDELPVKGNVFIGRLVTRADNNGQGCGCWTGPHYHIEFSQNGHRIDPIEGLIKIFNCAIPFTTKKDGALVPITSGAQCMACN